MGGRLGRFSLVELMIAVAIIGTLAAIAIPALHSMQLKAKAAELPVLLDGMRSASEAYLSIGGIFAAGDTVTGPDTTPGKELRAWPGFPQVGFSPDGKVRGSYTLLGVSRCEPIGLACYGDPPCGTGVMDLDEDGHYLQGWFHAKESNYTCSSGAF